MTTPKTVIAENLRIGELVFVRGFTSFSRIARIVEGEALAASIARDKASGRQYIIEVPHTSLTIYDAQVVPAVAGLLTPEETYVKEHMYTGLTGENAGKVCYGVDNKGPFLPTVLEPDTDNPGSFRQIKLPRELDKGIPVTLVLNVFDSKRPKKGLGLQQVILHEAPRYYGAAGVDTAALRARGIVVSGEIVAVRGSDSTAEVPTETAPALPPNAIVDANGFPAPAPAPIAPVAPHVETEAEELLRLRRERAAAASGGNSPFGDSVPATPAAGAGVDPWATPTTGPAFQG